MVGRFVEGMEARYPLFDDLDDGGRVYWDLSALEACETVSDWSRLYAGL